MFTGGSSDRTTGSLLDAWGSEKHHKRRVFNLRWHVGLADLLNHRFSLELQQDLVLHANKNTEMRNWDKTGDKLFLVAEKMRRITQTLFMFTDLGISHTSLVNVQIFHYKSLRFSYKIFPLSYFMKQLSVSVWCFLMRVMLCCEAEKGIMGIHHWDAHLVQSTHTGDSLQTHYLDFTQFIISAVNITLSETLLWKPQHIRTSTIICTCTTASAVATDNVSTPSDQSKWKKLLFLLFTLSTVNEGEKISLFYLQISVSVNVREDREKFLLFWYTQNGHRIVVRPVGGCWVARRRRCGVRGHEWLYSWAPHFLQPSPPHAWGSDPPSWPL